MILPLYSALNITSVVLGSLVGSPVQEPHVHTGTDPVKDHEDDDENGPSDM